LCPRIGAGVRSHVSLRKQVGRGHGPAPPLHPPTGEQLREVIRYERDRVSGPVHAGIKKLGRIPTGGGRRIHTAGTESARTSKRSGPGAGRRVRAVLHANELVVYDGSTTIVRHERLIAKGGERLVLGLALSTRTGSRCSPLREAPGASRIRTVMLHAVAVSGPAADETRWPVRGGAARMLSASSAEDVCSFSCVLGAVPG
jgi:hypothetical protein